MIKKQNFNFGVNFWKIIESQIKTRKIIRHKLCDFLLESDYIRTLNKKDLEIFTPKSRRKCIFLVIFSNFGFKL